jgi:SAM-dependent methyltransferase
MNRTTPIPKIEMRPCPGCGAAAWRPRFHEPPFRIVQCLSCTLVYLGNPPPEEALYDDYYAGETLPLNEYRSDSGDPRLRELHAINRQRIDRIGRMRPAGTLLDIGCGRGQFLHTAREHGYETYGIDVSERAIDQARREFGLEVDVRTLEDLVASGRKFDVVTLWHVLEHFVEPLPALAQVHALLRDDGICVAEVPNLRSLKFLLSQSKWEGGNHPRYHRTFFTASTLRATLVRSSFTRVRRMLWSYHVPGRSGGYEMAKRGLDLLGLDAFLDVVAWK